MGSENKLKGALVMSRDDFWDLIAQAKEACGMGEDEYVQWVKEQLKELGPHYAQDFHDILHAYSDFADQYGLWSAVGMMGQSSDDKFIDFRSWLIAQGRETYFKVLKDPDSLADIEPGDGFWFESFTYVGDTALHELNGGNAYEGTNQAAYGILTEELKENVEFGEGINYPFEADELPDYFPKLSQKYPGKYCRWNYTNNDIRTAREAGPPPKPGPVNNIEMGGM